MVVALDTVKLKNSLTSVTLLVDVLLFPTQNVLDMFVKAFEQAK